MFLRELLQRVDKLIDGLLWVWKYTATHATRRVIDDAFFVVTVSIVEAALLFTALAAGYILFGGR